MRFCTLSTRVRDRSAGIAGWGRAGLGIAVCMVTLAVFRAPADAPGSGIPYCPIVDGGRDSLAAISLGLAPDEAIAGAAADFGFLETIGRVSLGYYRTSMGDFDLALGGRFWIATGGGYGLPDSFGQGFVRIRWELRTTQGLTLRTDALPGMYSGSSHLELDNFNVPFALSGIQAFNKVFAVQGGVHIHPGYAFDPIVGLRYAPHRDLTLDLAYPETRIRWNVHPVLALVGGYQVNRMWHFSLDDDDPSDNLTIRDHRLYLGADLKPGGFMTFTVRAGRLLSREIDYSPGPEADVADGFFFALGIAGEF
ncbi:MAG: hypothetical protein KJ579_05810 [Verrucomicrobia bacterium]|nr:hypothetical protein [Verrucomicrobiota bacterium]